MQWVLAQSGSGGGIPWGQIIQILFVLLIFGGGAIQRVYKSAREKSKKRQALEAQRRREEEALRTGRMSTQGGAQVIPHMGPNMGPPPDAEMGRPVATSMGGPMGGPAMGGPSGPGTIVAGDDEAKRRLTELARRRREQIEQMTRGQPPPTQTTSTQVPSPTPGRVRPAPQPASQPMSPSRPTPPVVAVPGPSGSGGRQGNRQQKKEGSKKEQRKARPSAEISSVGSDTWLSGPKIGERRSQLDRERDLMTAAEAAASGPAPAPPTTMRSTLIGALRVGAGGSTEELRRALILGEVLGRPLAERDQVDRSWAEPVQMDQTRAAG